MATVNKDFKIKSGLIVEGTTATVNNFDVLTKKTADQNYIIDLIGGTATSANTANTVVKRAATGDFAAGDITADLIGNVTGTVSDISNHDTDDLGEGTINQYFTNQRALDATNAAYDAAGTGAAEADVVAGDLSDHEAATAAHGATGAVVGTTNTQTLTNKTIGDTLNFTGAGAMTINSDSHIVLTPAAGSSVKWGADVLATRGYADQAEADAISTASADATTKADAAEADAISAAATDATNKVAAEAALRVSGDSASVATASADATSKANAAQAAAEATAAADATAKADAAQAAANAYTDAEVAALVDSAPALLDTLNELAAAISDNPNYATDLATAVGEKVAKAGDTMTGALTLSGAPTSSLHAATKGYVDTAESNAASDATSKANAAQAAAEATASADATTKANNAKSGAEATASSDATSKVAAEAALRVSGDSASVATASADATSKANAAQAAAEATASADATSKANAAKSAAEATASADATSKANAAQAAAIAHADALDTDDVAEGTAQYFTDARAKASAADLLTGATKTNITITGSGSGLVITAENGVADSDTDDLDEGTTNLYFTDVRAVDALEAVVPNFTAVELNSVAKQVAATLSAPTAGVQTAHAFAKADYRSAEYLVKVAYGTHTEISKVLLTLDTSDNIAITEYGIVGTNGSASSVSAGISGSNVQLQVTTVNNNSTVTVVGTLVA